MAELEIHHEGHETDPFGMRIGILTSVLAVLLAVVTIASHRAHTQGVLIKSDENDKWSFYQSKRLKLHNMELGDTMVSLLAPKNSETEAALANIRKEKKRYEEDSKEAQEQAEALERRVEHAEARALRYDVGEGLIEIGLVLSSLYFIAKKRYFPLMGIIAGILGALAAASGLFV